MKNKYPEYFTVKDLKKMLEKIPDDLPIGRAGHFGEFCEMDKYDFSVVKASKVPVRKGWRDMDQEKIDVFQVISPDIGPDPD